jgi:hypothetical protein
MNRLATQCIVLNNSKSKTLSAFITIENGIPEAHISLDGGHGDVIFNFSLWNQLKQNTPKILTFKQQQTTPLNISLLDDEQNIVVDAITRSCLRFRQFFKGEQVSMCHIAEPTISRFFKLISFGEYYFKKFELSKNEIKQFLSSGRRFDDGSYKLDINMLALEMNTGVAEEDSRPTTYFAY